MEEIVQENLKKILLKTDKLEHLRFSKDFVILTVKFNKDMINFISFIDRDLCFSVGKKYYDF